MRILLAQPDTSTQEGFRDLVLLSVLYDSGARVQELVDFKIKNIRLENPPVLTLHGKGSKTRQIPIMKNTQKLLTAYLEQYYYNQGISKDENYIFVNQKRQQLSRWGISYIINKYVKEAEKNTLFDGGFPVTPHVFRNPNLYEIPTFCFNYIIEGLHEL